MLPIRNWLLASAHALWLILLQMFYLNSNWVAPVEEDIAETLTKVETFFFPTPKADDKVIFVNTALATSTTTINDKGTTGTISITDRQKLADLFSYLAAHNNQHKYVLCDIRFNNSSAADSSLQKSINNLRNYILPQHVNPQNDSFVQASFIKGRTGIADYITYGVVFSKMMLFQKKHGNSIPMQMFQDMPGCGCKPFQFTYTRLGLRSGLNSIPNSIFPKFYFTKEDLRQHEIGLNALINVIDASSKSGNDSSFYNSFFKDNIIVIGNFNDDIQPTAIGFVPGTLILLNSFLTLKNQHDLYGVSYLFFLFVCFTIISYYVFHHKELQKKFMHKKFPLAVRHFFKKDRLFFVLMVISIVGNIWFGIRSTILLLTLYFIVLEHSKNIIRFLKNRFI